MERPPVPNIPTCSKERVLALAKQLNVCIKKDTPQHLWPVALFIPIIERLEAAEHEVARVRRELAKMKAEGGHFKKGKTK